MLSGARNQFPDFCVWAGGVGKTTLRLKTEQLITAELLNQLQEDRMRIPVASVEAVAPESGSLTGVTITDASSNSLTNADRL